MSDLPQRWQHTRELLEKAEGIQKEREGRVHKFQDLRGQREEASAERLAEIEEEIGVIEEAKAQVKDAQSIAAGFGSNLRKVNNVLNAPMEEKKDTSVLSLDSASLRTKVGLTVKGTSRSGGSTSDGSSSAASTPRASPFRPARKGSKAVARRGSTDSNSSVDSVRSGPVRRKMKPAKALKTPKTPAFPKSPNSPKSIEWKAMEVTIRSEMGQQLKALEQKLEFQIAENRRLKERGVSNKIWNGFVFDKMLIFKNKADYLDQQLNAGADTQTLKQLQEEIAFYRTERDHLYHKILAMAPAQEQKQVGYVQRKLEIEDNTDGSQAGSTSTMDARLGLAYSSIAKIQKKCLKLYATNASLRRVLMHSEQGRLQSNDCEADFVQYVSARGKFDLEEPSPEPTSKSSSSPLSTFKLDSPKTKAGVLYPTTAVRDLYPVDMKNNEKKFFTTAWKAAGLATEGPLMGAFSDLINIALHFGDTMLQKNTSLCYHMGQYFKDDPEMHTRVLKALQEGMKTVEKERDALHRAFRKNFRLLALAAADEKQRIKTEANLIDTGTRDMGVQVNTISESTPKKDKKHIVFETDDAPDPAMVGSMKGRKDTSVHDMALEVDLLAKKVEAMMDDSVRFMKQCRQRLKPPLEMANSVQILSNEPLPPLALPTKEQSTHMPANTVEVIKDRIAALTAKMQPGMDALKKYMEFVNTPVPKESNTTQENNTAPNLSKRDSKANVVKGNLDKRPTVPASPQGGSGISSMGQLKPKKGPKPPAKKEPLKGSKSRNDSDAEGAEPGDGKRKKSKAQDLLAKVAEMMKEGDTRVDTSPKQSPKQSPGEQPNPTKAPSPAGSLRRWGSGVDDARSAGSSSSDDEYGKGARKSSSVEVKFLELREELQRRLDGLQRTLEEGVEEPKPDSTTTLFLYLKDIDRLQESHPRSISRIEEIVRNTVELINEKHRYLNQNDRGMGNIVLIFDHPLTAIQFAESLLQSLLTAPWPVAIMDHPKCEAVLDKNGRTILIGPRLGCVLDSGPMSHTKYVLPSGEDAETWQGTPMDRTFFLLQVCKPDKHTPIIIGSNAMGHLGDWATDNPSIVGQGSLRIPMVKIGVLDYKRYAVVGPETYEELIGPAVSNDNTKSQSGSKWSVLNSKLSAPLASSLPIHGYSLQSSRNPVISQIRLVEKLLDDISHAQSQLKLQDTRFIHTLKSVATFVQAFPATKDFPSGKAEQQEEERTEQLREEVDRIAEADVIGFVAPTNAQTSTSDLGSGRVPAILRGIGNAADCVNFIYKNTMDFVDTETKRALSESPIESFAIPADSMDLTHLFIDLSHYPWDHELMVDLNKNVQRMFKKVAEDYVPWALICSLPDLKLSDPTAKLISSVPSATQAITIKFAWHYAFESPSLAWNFAYQISKELMEFQVPRCGDELESRKDIEPHYSEDNQRVLRGLRMKIGIETGSCQHYSIAGDQYLGVCVNIAGRLCQAAPPGAIYIGPQLMQEMEVSQKDVDGSMFHPYASRNKGTHRFKGISEHVEVFSVQPEEFKGRWRHLPKNEHAQWPGRVPDPVHQVDNVEDAANAIEMALLDVIHKLDNQGDLGSFSDEKEGRSALGDWWITSELAKTQYRTNELRRFKSLIQQMAENFVGDLTIYEHEIFTMALSDELNVTPMSPTVELIGQEVVFRDGGYTPATPTARPKHQPKIVSVEEREVQTDPIEILDGSKARRSTGITFQHPLDFENAPPDQIFLSISEEPASGFEAITEAEEIDKRPRSGIASSEGAPPSPPLVPKLGMPGDTLVVSRQATPVSSRIMGLLTPRQQDIMNNVVQSRRTSLTPRSPRLPHLTVRRGSSQKKAGVERFRDIVKVVIRRNKAKMQVMRDIELDLRSSTDPSNKSVGSTKSHMTRDVFVELMMQTRELENSLVEEKEKVARYKEARQKLRQAQVPVGKVTFVFLDIEYSAELLEAYPPLMEEFIDQFTVLVRQWSSEFEGYEVRNIKDAFILAFPECEKALAFANEAHQGMMNVDLPRGLFITEYGKHGHRPDTEGVFCGCRLRIGINTGMASYCIDPRNSAISYFGPVVAKCAKLHAFCNGGYTLLAQETVQEISEELAAANHLIDLGDKELSGQTMQLWSLLPSALHYRAHAWGLYGTGIVADVVRPTSLELDLKESNPVRESDQPCPQGEVSLVCIDIEGSPVFWDMFPDAMPVVAYMYSTLVKYLAVKFSGYEVYKLKESFMFAFQSPLSAFLFCCQLQTMMLTQQWPEPLHEEVRDEEGVMIWRSIRLRSVMCMGYPELEFDMDTGQARYYGQLVTKVACLSQSSPSGITIMTDTEYAALKETEIFESDYTVESYGKHKLRGFDRAQEMYGALPVSLKGRWSDFEKLEDIFEMRKSKLPHQVVDHRNSSVTAEHISTLAGPQVWETKEEQLNNILHNLEAFKEKVQADDLDMELWRRLKGATGHVVKGRHGLPVHVGIQVQIDNLPNLSLTDEDFLTNCHLFATEANNVLTMYKQRRAMARTLFARQSALEEAGMQDSPRQYLPNYPDGDQITLLMAGIYGSASLWNQFPDQMAVANVTFSTLMRSLMQDWGGHLVRDIQDTHAVAFSEPIYALKFAMELHHTIMDQAWPSELTDSKFAEEATGPNGQFLFKGLRVRVAMAHGGVESWVDQTQKRVGYSGQGMQRIISMFKIAPGGYTLTDSKTCLTMAPSLSKDVVLQDGPIEPELDGFDGPVPTMFAHAKQYEARFQHLHMKNKSENMASDHLIQVGMNHVGEMSVFWKHQETRNEMLVHKLEDYESKIHAMISVITELDELSKKQTQLITPAPATEKKSPARTTKSFRMKQTPSKQNIRTVTNRLREAKRQQEASKKQEEKKEIAAIASAQAAAKPDVMSVYTQTAFDESDKARERAEIAAKLNFKKTAIQLQHQTHSIKKNLLAEKSRRLRKKMMSARNLLGFKKSKEGGGDIEAEKVHDDVEAEVREQVEDIVANFDEIGESFMNDLSDGNVVPSGRVSVVFTDVMGIKEIWSVYPIATQAALKMHTSLIKHLTMKHQGFQVKRVGDSHMIVFSNATQALAFSCAVQESHMEQVWPAELTNMKATSLVKSKGQNSKVVFRGLRVRIGFTSGECREERNLLNGLTTFSGEVPFLACQISSLPPGGFVYIGHAAFEELEPTGALGRYAVESLGELALPTGNGKEDIHSVLPKHLSGRFTLTKKMKRPNFKYSNMLKGVVADLSDTARPEIEPGPSGQVTIVFLSINGEESFYAEEEDEILTETIAIYNTTVKIGITKHGGYEVRHLESSFMIAFKDIQKALSFCTSVQEGLVKQIWPQALKNNPWCKVERDPMGSATVFKGPRVKMGLSTGLVNVAHDPIIQRTDYYGPIVERGLQTSIQAPGGHILMTKECYRLLSEENAFAKCVVSSIGIQQLKGLEPEELFTVQPISLQGRFNVQAPTHKVTANVMEKALVQMVGDGAKVVAPTTGPGTLVITCLEQSRHLAEIMPEVFADCLRILGDVLCTLSMDHKGFEVKSIKDINMAAFSCVHDAMGFACAVQTVLLQQMWPVEILDHRLGAELEDPKTGELVYRGPRVGMSLATGLLYPKKNANGEVAYSGDVMARAVHLANLSNAGLIFIDSNTYRQIDAEADIMEYAWREVSHDDKSGVFFAIASQRFGHRLNEMKERDKGSLDHLIPTLETDQPPTIDGPTGEVAVVALQCRGVDELAMAHRSLFDEVMVIKNAVMRDVVVEQGGYILGGEELLDLIVFSNLAAAVEFSTELHKALLDAEWPKGGLDDMRGFEVEMGDDGEYLFRGVRVAMGISFGIVRHDHDPMTQRTIYFGGALSLASDILAVCPMGHTYMSKDSKVKLEAYSEATLKGKAIVHRGLRRLREHNRKCEIFSILPESLKGRQAKKYLPTEFFGCSLTLEQTMPPPSLLFSKLDHGPTGELTVLFTEVQGAAQLWQELGTEIMGEALKIHNTCVQSLTATHSGFLVSMEGDAYHIVFSYTHDALKFAADLHEHLCNSSWPPGIGNNEDTATVLGDDGDLIFNGLRCRIGIAVGVPEVQTHPLTGRTNYSGEPVRTAAMIATLSAGGYTYVDSEVMACMEAEDTCTQFSSVDIGEVDMQSMGVRRIYSVLPISCQGRHAFDEGLSSEEPADGEEGSLANKGPRKLQQPDASISSFIKSFNPGDFAVPPTLPQGHAEHEVKLPEVAAHVVNPRLVWGGVYTTLDGTAADGDPELSIKSDLELDALLRKVLAYEKTLTHVPQGLEMFDSLQADADRITGLGSVMDTLTLEVTTQTDTALLDAMASVGTSTPRANPQANPVVASSGVTLIQKVAELLGLRLDAIRFGQTPLPTPTGSPLILPPANSANPGKETAKSDAKNDRGRGSRPGSISSRGSGRKGDSPRGQATSPRSGGRSSPRKGKSPREKGSTPRGKKEGLHLLTLDVPSDAARDLFATLPTSVQRTVVKSNIIPNAFTTIMTDLTNLLYMVGEMLTSELSLMRYYATHKEAECIRGTKTHPNVIDGKQCFVFCQIHDVQTLLECHPGYITEALCLFRAVLRHAISFKGLVNLAVADHYMITFETVVEAIDFACSLQETLMMQEWPQDFTTYEDTDRDGNVVFRGLRISLGLEFGEFTQEIDKEGHVMYEGRAAVRAAKICSMAPGGFVWIGGTAKNQIQNNVNYEITDLGAVPGEKWHAFSVSTLSLATRMQVKLPRPIAPRTFFEELYRYRGPVSGFLTLRMKRLTSMINDIKAYLGYLENVRIGHNMFMIKPKGSKIANAMVGAVSDMLELSDEPMSPRKLINQSLMTSNEVVIVFLGMDQSGPLWSDMPVEMKEACRIYHQTIHDLINENQGVHVKTKGESVMARFDHLDHALNFCTTGQGAFLIAQWPELLLGSDAYQTVDNPKEEGGFLFRGPRVRMALAMGSADVDLDPDTNRSVYLGATPRQCALLCANCPGGYILLPKDTYMRMESLGVPQNVALTQVKIPDIEGEVYSVQNIALKDRFDMFEGIYQNETRDSKLNDLIDQQFSRSLATSKVLESESGGVDTPNTAQLTRGISARFGGPRSTSPSSRQIQNVETQTDESGANLKPKTPMQVGTMVSDVGVQVDNIPASIVTTGKKHVFTKGLSQVAKAMKAFKKTLLDDQKPADSKESEETQIFLQDYANDSLLAEEADVIAIPVPSETSGRQLKRFGSMNIRRDSSGKVKEERPEEDEDSDAEDGDDLTGLDVLQSCIGACMEGTPPPFKPGNLVQSIVEALPILDMVEDVDSDHFDLWHWNTICSKKGGILFQTAMNILTRYSFMDSCKIDISKLACFIYQVQIGYNDNPYHNAIHAADVMQTVHWIIRACQFDQTLDDIALLALLVSALVHDLDHPGVNNAFLTNTRNPLAITYNDQSVLESYHVASGFRLILLQEGCNWLENLTEAEFTRLRDLMIHLVLGTDMKFHFGLVQTLQEAEASGESGHGLDEKMLLKTILHTADISNPMKPWDIYLPWAERVMREFYQQGTYEQMKGLKYSPFCNPYVDRPVALVNCQIGFIDFVVRPLVKCVVDLLPLCKVLQTNLDGNHTKLKGRLEELQSRPTPARWRATIFKFVNPEGINLPPTRQDYQTRENCRKVRTLIGDVIWVKRYSKLYAKQKYFCLAHVAGRIPHIHTKYNYKDGDDILKTLMSRKGYKAAGDTMHSERGRGWMNFRATGEGLPPLKTTPSASERDQLRDIINDGPPVLASPKSGSLTGGLSRTPPLRSNPRGMVDEDENMVPGVPKRNLAPNALAELETGPPDSMLHFVPASQSPRHDIRRNRKDSTIIHVGVVEVRERRHSHTESNLTDALDVLTEDGSTSTDIPYKRNWKPPNTAERKLRKKKATEFKVKFEMIFKHWLGELPLPPLWYMLPDAGKERIVGMLVDDEEKSSGMPPKSPRSPSSPKSGRSTGSPRGSVSGAPGLGFGASSVMEFLYNSNPEMAACVEAVVLYNQGQQIFIRFNHAQVAEDAASVLWSMAYGTFGLAAGQVTTVFNSNPNHMGEEDHLGVVFYNMKSSDTILPLLAQVDRHASMSPHSIKEVVFVRKQTVLLIKFKATIHTKKAIDAFNDAIVNGEAVKCAVMDTCIVLVEVHGMQTFRVQTEHKGLGSIMEANRDQKANALIDHRLEILSHIQHLNKPLAIRPIGQAKVALYFPGPEAAAAALKALHGKHITHVMKTLPLSVSMKATGVHKNTLAFALDSAYKDPKDPRSFIPTLQIFPIKPQFLRWTDADPQTRSRVLKNLRSVIDIHGVSKNRENRHIELPPESEEVGKLEYLKEYLSLNGVGMPMRPKSAVVDDNPLMIVGVKVMSSTRIQVGDILLEIDQGMGNNLLEVGRLRAAATFRIIRMRVAMNILKKKMGHEAEMEWWERMANAGNLSMAKLQKKRDELQLQRRELLAAIYRMAADDVLSPASEPGSYASARSTVQESIGHGQVIWDLSKLQTSARTKDPDAMSHASSDDSWGGSPGSFVWRRSGNAPWGDATKLRKRRLRSAGSTEGGRPETPTKPKKFKPTQAQAPKLGLSREEREAMSPKHGLQRRSIHADQPLLPRDDAELLKPYADAFKQSGEERRARILAELDKASKPPPKFTGPRTNFADAFKKAAGIGKGVAKADRRVILDSEGESTHSARMSPNSRKRESVNSFGSSNPSSHPIPSHKRMSVPEPTSKASFVSSHHSSSPTSSPRKLGPGSTLMPIAMSPSSSTTPSKKGSLGASKIHPMPGTSAPATSNSNSKVPKA